MSDQIPSAVLLGGHDIRRGGHDDRKYTRHVPALEFGVRRVVCDEFRGLFVAVHTAGDAQVAAGSGSRPRRGGRGKMVRRRPDDRDDDRRHRGAARQPRRRG